MDKLTDYIMTVDDSISKDLISRLLSEYENTADWKPYVSGKSGGDAPSNALLITHPTVLKNSASRKIIGEQVTKSILSVFDKYHEKFSRRLSGLNFLAVKQLVGLRLIRYEAGQSMDNHVDKYPDPDTGLEVWPAVTFTMNLNDDYSGGELNLLDGSLVVKAQAGQCVMFPANFLYPHEIHTVKNGTRYSLVGWFV